MNRVLTVSLLVLLSVVALRTVPAAAQNEKPPSIKEIMGRLNKGPNSLCPTLGKELRAEEPAWDQVQQGATDFARLAASLLKARPPKGEDDAWQQQAKVYADNAKALEDAAAQRDKKAAQTALSRLADMKSCSACHAMHRN